VSEITQTVDGYLWLGTPNGLQRFDGVKFDYLPLQGFSFPLMVLHFSWVLATAACGSA
jgi:ligand-binding sensor domain-containing protein